MDFIRLIDQCLFFNRPFKWFVKSPLCWIFKINCKKGHVFKQRHILQVQFPYERSKEETLVGGLSLAFTYTLTFPFSMKIINVCRFLEGDSNFIPSKSLATASCFIDVEMASKLNISS